MNASDPLVEVEVAVEHRVVELGVRHVGAVAAVVHRDHPSGQAADDLHRTNRVRRLPGTLVPFLTRESEIGRDPARLRVGPRLVGAASPWPPRARRRGRRASCGSSSPPTRARRGRGVGADRRSPAGALARSTSTPPGSARRSAGTRRTGRPPAAAHRAAGSSRRATGGCTRPLRGARRPTRDRPAGHRATARPLARGTTSSSVESPARCAWSASATCRTNCCRSVSTSGGPASSIESVSLRILELERPAGRSGSTSRRRRLRVTRRFWAAAAGPRSGHSRSQARSRRSGPRSTRSSSSVRTRARRSSGPRSRPRRSAAEAGRARRC